MPNLITIYSGMKLLHIFGLIRSKLRERYANNILWISGLGMILMSWEVTEKKRHRDSQTLYQGK